MSDASMNPNDSAPFDPIPEGSFSQDMPLQGADEFDDQETMPAMDESSWLLEESGSSEDPDFEHASVHALPDVFAEPPTESWLDEPEGGEESAPEEGAYDDDLVGASYVEPETSGHAFSKALIPGSIVLLLSFGGVGAWAFMKRSQDVPAADPLVAMQDAPMEAPDEEPEVELVKPEGADEVPIGRMSYQRDGAVIPAKGYGNVSPVTATVDSPREPGELPPGQAGGPSGAPSGSEETSRLASNGNGDEAQSTEVAASDSDAADGSADGDEIDIEFGTYVDSGETSLFGDDGGRESFQISDGGTESEGTEAVAGAGSSIGSLSPAFLDQFVLDVEPLDEDAVAMLNALEEEGAVDQEGPSTPATDSTEVRVAPLPGDAAYGSMAWAYPSGNGAPMSPAATYFDEMEGAAISGIDVAGTGSLAEVPSEDFVAESESVDDGMGPAIADDYMPFGLFDDDRASLDVEPDIRSLDVTEMNPATDNIPSETGPEGSEAPGQDVAAIDIKDSPSVDSPEPDQVGPEPAPELPLGDAASVDVQEPETPSDASAEDEPVLLTELGTPMDVAAVDVPEVETPVAEIPTVLIPDVEVDASPAEVDVAQVAVESIDLDDAHARLDAIFGPTPLEIQPDPEVAEPTLAQGGSDVPEEMAPEMSDEFSAPETLADADVPNDATGTENTTDGNETPEDAVIELALPDLGEPTIDVPAEESIDEPSAGSDVATMTEPLGWEPGGEVVAGSAAEDAPVNGSEQGLEVTVTVAAPETIAQAGGESTGEPIGEPQLEGPTGPDVVLPTAVEPIDLAVGEEPKPAGENTGEDTAENTGENTAEPVNGAEVAPDSGNEVADLKIDPKSLILSGPDSPVLAVEVGPKGPVTEPSSDPSSMAEDVAVEVRPSLAEEVRSPRRGSVLTRIGTGDIWPHRTVPKSKLKGAKFVLTPNVGQVRIVFDGGDTLDGRLHGVGDNKIAIDNRLGRLTLDARRVDRLDRLGKNNQRTASGEVSTKGLDKVRVQADGGVFLGHLLSREGNRVTLLLSEGMRVTLESDDIRPAGRQKTVSRLRRPK